MIVKSDADILHISSLRLIYTYLSNRKQKVKINGTYSSWSDILSRVRRGSILGPLLLNAFIFNLFFFIPDSNIASYADGKTPYSAKKELMHVLHVLKKDSDMKKWFKKKFLKANPEKYDLLMGTDKNNTLRVEESSITNSECEKLLGIKTDSQFCFQNHVKSLCKKASQKLNALLRVVCSLTFPQRKLLLNVFITSQFPYIPIVWMFHSRKLNHRINNIHERAFRLVYKDYNSSLNDLLVKDSFFKDSS